MHITSREVAAVLLALSIAESVVAEPAAAAAPQPTSQPQAGVVVDDLTLDVVLQAHPHYKNLQAAVDKLDAEIATTPLGPAHPRIVGLRAKRAAWRQKLDDVREEVRAAVEGRVAADAGRVDRARDGARGGGFVGEGLGMVVDRVPAATAAGLNLPRGAGLLVHRVLRNTAASAATILPGDVLVRLDGQLLVNNEQFEVVVESLKRDGEVEIQLFRDGSPLKRTIRVTTGAK